MRRKEYLIYEKLDIIQMALIYQHAHTFILRFKGFKWQGGGSKIRPKKVDLT